MSDMVLTPEQVIQQTIESAKKSDDYNSTVALLREGCATVLGRIKNNLSQTVAEKSDVATRTFIDNVVGDLSQQTNEWIRQNSNQLLVVPEGTRLVHRDAQVVTIIVEQKPTVRTVRFGYHGGGRESVYNNYQISLPYIQYYITFGSDGANDRFSQMYISSTTKSLETLADRVNHFPLPNVGRDGRVCTGNMDVGDRRGVNLVDKINHIISGFWSSNFNFDLRENCIVFFMSNFAQQYARRPDDATGLEPMQRGFAEWAAKTTADPMFGLKANYQLKCAAGDFIPSNLASANGRTALMNRMKSKIEDGVSTFVKNLTSDLNTVNILEENRNQPHMVALNNHVTRATHNAYNQMWRAVHDRHLKEFNINMDCLQKKEREVQNLVANSANVVSRIEKAKTDFNDEKIKVQCELYNLYQYLQKQIEQVNELKAKLSHLVDENGNPLPTKRRGRPRKELLPESVEMTLDRVVRSPIVVGPDGQPIPRKRGRPRKNPIPA